MSSSSALIFAASFCTAANRFRFPLIRDRFATSCRRLMSSVNQSSALASENSNGLLDTTKASRDVFEVVLLVVSACRILQLKLVFSSNLFRHREMKRVCSAQAGSIWKGRTSPRYFVV